MLYQENLTVLNKHTPNIKTLKYIKQTLTDLKGDIDRTIVGEFDAPSTTMDRSSEHSIDKKVL